MVDIGVLSVWYVAQIPLLAGGRGGGSCFMTALHRPLQVSQLRLQPLQLWCKALTFQWRRHPPQVPKLRWAECAACQARMEAEGLPDEAALQSWFIRRAPTTPQILLHIVSM